MLAQSGRSRLTFKQRGGWWVVAQAALLLTAAVTAPLTGALLSWPLRLVPYLILAAAALLGGWAAAALGRGLTPYPRPLENARLCVRGPYRCVRHPMYSAVLMAAAGWAWLWQSPVGGILLIALYVFFELKSSREERWLEENDPAYAAYRARVKRFLPWVR